MMKGGHGPTKQLQDLKWGAFDHAFHAPQLRSCNYYMANMHCSCLGHATTTYMYMYYESLPSTIISQPRGIPSCACLGTPNL